MKMLKLVKSLKLLKNRLKGQEDKCHIAITLNLT